MILLVAWDSKLFSCFNLHNKIEFDFLLKTGSADPTFLLNQVWKVLMLQAWMWPKEPRPVTDS